MPRIVKNKYFDLVGEGDRGVNPFWEHRNKETQSVTTYFELLLERFSDEADIDKWSKGEKKSNWRFKEKEIYLRRQIEETFALTFELMSYRPCECHNSTQLTQII